jgi:GNAT superfamily N-acetyltransferase
MSIRINAAAPSDARAIAALRTEVAQGMTRYHGEGHWSAIPSKADVLKQMRATHMLVARLDDEVVGTVRLATVEPHLMARVAFTPVDSSLYVLGLAVASRCRGQGIGRLLMDAAKDVARFRRAEALWLDAYDNDAGAGPFYLRCDFRRVGVSPCREVPLAFFEWLTGQR